MYTSSGQSNSIGPSGVISFTLYEAMQVTLPPFADLSPNSASPTFGMGLRLVTAGFLGMKEVLIMVAEILAIIEGGGGRVSRFLSGVLVLG